MEHEMIPFIRGNRASTGSAKSASRGHIGLEFAREKLHMVQLEKDSQGRIALRARCSLAYDSDRDQLLQSVQTLKPTITRALKSDRFKGRRVTSVLPQACCPTSWCAPCP
jgi:Tfp pilus assembly PilM family ATPase